MRIAPVRAATLFVAIAGAWWAAAAPIPPLPEIDPTQHPELAARRAALERERDDLRARSGVQRQRCAAVEEGTPAERDCAAWRERIAAEVAVHIAATDALVRALSMADGQVPFTLSVAAVQGEFYLLTADGRRLVGDQISGTAIDGRTVAVTGAGSRAQLTLADGTSLSIGANAELVLDEFIYDPAPTARKRTLRMVKGVFRWVTAKVTPHPPGWKFELPGLAGGIRGTDFTCTVRPDGSGTIELHSGEIELRETASGKVTILRPAQRVDFDSGVVGTPQPIVVPDPRPVG